MFSLSLKDENVRALSHKGFFLKEVDIIKRKQTETLKLKSTGIKERLVLGTTQRLNGRRKNQQTQRDIN